MEKPIHEQEEWIKIFLSPIQNILTGKMPRECGNHIHLSKKDTTPKDLAESIRYVSPILLSLFQDRTLGTESSYGRAVPFEELHNSRGAIHLSNKDSRSTLELRVIPALPSVPELVNRLELIRLMLKHNKIQSYTDSYKMVLDDTHEFSKFVMSVYCNNSEANYEKFLENMFTNIVRFG